MEQQAELGIANPVFTALSDSRRRVILDLLQDRKSAVSIEDLATHVVARAEEKPLVEVSPFRVRDLCVELYHRDLPLLEDSGLVSLDLDEGMVATTDHPALLDPKLDRLTDQSDPDFDMVLANLAYRRRRVILSILKDSEARVSREDLAEEVVTREPDTDEEDQTTTENVESSLHHVHLPQLERAGLVVYDDENGTVAYEDHPALEDEWLQFQREETPRAILPAARRSDDIWAIDGRDHVIARGQSLFEQADEELFLMFTTDGLLEEGCIRRLQDAIDRGVDVYLGSQTDSVRDLVRERVPGAVLWEPQMDWLNLPPDYEKVGRLVFADREAVMLATLGERYDEGTHREAAITGAGENNPLVVLLRELLGSRLDHLDAQSEDFLSKLPL